jgi:hypothetical protein
MPTKVAEARGCVGIYEPMLTTTHVHAWLVLLDLVGSKLLLKVGNLTSQGSGLAIHEEEVCTKFHHPLLDECICLWPENHWFHGFFTCRTSDFLAPHQAHTTTTL